MKEKSWLEKNIGLPVLAHPEYEKENSISHLIPAIAAIFGLIYILLNLKTVKSNNLRVGLVIFGLSNILLYGASSLYHGLKPSNAKRFCRILDHSNIYVLIAGTYTPLLLYINTTTSIYLTIALWIIVALGITFTLVFWEKLKPLHVVLYIAMGWIIVFFFNDIVPNLPHNIFNYMIAGGLFYTLGVIFYGIKKIPHGHLIWHLFCIAGSLSFYIAILKYIL